MPSFSGNTIPNAVQLPPAAILPSDDGGTNVLVVGADGTAQKRSVQVGIRTQAAVQIVSGVTPADMVITEGGYGLDDGTKVKIGDEATRRDDSSDRHDKGAKD